MYHLTSQSQAPHPPSREAYHQAINKNLTFAAQKGTNVPGRRVGLPQILEALVGLGRDRRSIQNPANIDLPLSGEKRIPDSDQEFKTLAQTPQPACTIKAARWQRASYKNPPTCSLTAVALAITSEKRER